MTIWCRLDGRRASYGIVEGENVIAVEGTPFGAHKKTARALPLKHVKLMIPVVPPTFYCVGINYADHIRKMAAKRNTEPVFPKKPDIGYRANNALIAHEEDIVKPKDAGEAFQYEGELVAVFGRRARNVSPRERARLRAGLDHRQRRLRAHLAEGATARCGAPRTPTPSSRWGRGSSPGLTPTTWRR